jgi:hypothetical protein
MIKLYYREYPSIGTEVEIPVGEKILRIDWDKMHKGLNYRFIAEKSRSFDGEPKNAQKGQLFSIIKAIWSADFIAANWRDA